MADTCPVARRRVALNALLPVGDTLKYALMNSAYTPNQTSYATTHEATGTGYPAGGNAVTGATNATGTNKAYSDIADPVFPGLTCSDFQWGVLYDTSDSNHIIDEQDLGAQSVTAVDVTITQPSAAEGTAFLRL